MVTICTASLTFNSSTFCPHSVFMCFVWIWEQTAIISLYNINWLLYITKSECVYCAYRAESFYIAVVPVAKDFPAIFHGLTAQAYSVSYRHPNITRISPCCCSQNTEFGPKCPTSFPYCAHQKSTSHFITSPSSHIFLTPLLSRRDGMGTFES